MTQRLATARREASLSQALVEAERTNLEVILARLSTGVLALESDLTIRTANQASGSILGVRSRTSLGEALLEVAKGHRCSNSLSMLRACISMPAKLNGASRSCCAVRLADAS